MGFSIHFVLRKDVSRKDEMKHVFMRITINRKPVRYKTNVYIPDGKWDIGKEKIKGTAIGAGRLNYILDVFRNKAMNAYTDVLLNNLPLNHHTFEKYFLNDKLNDKSFFTFFDEYIEHFKESLSPETIKSLVSELNKLKSYKNDILVTDLSPEFISNYEQHLRVKLANNGNTVQKSIKKINAVLNYFVKIQRIPLNPIAGYRVKGESTSREFLTPEELTAMERLLTDARIKGNLLESLKHFLFSCYTGLRFQDLKNLKGNNLIYAKSSTYIRVTMHKTNETITIPLIAKALKLLPKNIKEKDFVFSVISNQHTNQFLKDLAEVAKIKKQLSFHCARHTFATIALNTGIPMEVVQKLLGHTLLKTTQIYAKIVDTTIFREMEKME